MKNVKILAFLLAILMLTSLVACTTPPAGNGVTDTPGDNTGEGGDVQTPEYETITSAQALELCGEPGNITTERYYIRATVKTVTNAAYGQMIIEDETGSIEVYGTYSADGELTFSALDERPVKGDEVLLHCILQNYNGTKEVKNARLIEFKKNVANVDLSAYTTATVKEAREAAVGTKVKVSGVVAAITYANGMKPIGFVLVDNTQSIYVYGGDATQQVQVGNKVEIAASKTYWILSDEQSLASKFGYQGCNQLDDAYLISNDKKTDNVFDKSWIEESTVKMMLDTPVTEDITTQIFKVNALVSKVPGSGFTNYYFNDLDGKTGTYTYTQCNGGDFSWLDQYDGKICTVYLMLLNAKSTQSGCVWRFLPVAVEDNGFTFDKSLTAQHVVEYYGLPQFLDSYSGDPALEVVTSVDSELLGFEGATLTYTSDNTAVVDFKTEGGKTVMHCGEVGIAQITIKGEYNGNTYSQTVKIAVTGNTDVPSVNVAGAIAAPAGETITVKGIVGPSLVNQTGFYLIDESGIIAILTDATTMATVQLGNEVILTGTRFHKQKDGATDFGQTCIQDAKIVANSYGKHEYSTASFITGKTLADFAALDKTKDHTTEVYVLTAKIVVEETQYSKNIYLVDGDTKVTLYCSSANQYRFLSEFAGQTVTIEVAPCNWNCKGYKGCVLSVITEDGKILNELNFTK